MASDKKNMERERKRLTAIIKQWNESRLDLFTISLPDEKLDCNGVMRFYHKDTSNNGKYATKCIRVTSNSSTKDVIEMLSTKFRPDMRMLTKPKYVINEVHVDGEMRQLNDKEKPLLVQLSWVKDDREGRFLLHNVNDKAPVRLIEQFIGPDNEDSSFKLTRNLTKKEKKHKKKQEKERSKKNATEDGQDAKKQEIYTVKHLYSQVPESTFTRTVSNPEAVMKKRREQKLQKRGANILKVYGDRLNPEIPYKSLLLLPTDNVTTVIRDALDKYSLGKEKIQNYNLIQVVLPPNSKPEDMFDGGWGMETVLHDPQCPLEIEQKWQPHEGTLVFQLRHVGTKSKASKDPSPPSSHVSASDTEKKSESKKTTHESAESGQDSDNKSSKSSRLLPKFIELFASSNETREHPIHPDVTEIGNDRRKGCYKYYIELKDAKPCHCLVTSMDGVVSVTPQDRCDVYVNGKPIIETTMISHGAIVRVGRGKDLVYCEPKGKVSMPEIRKKLQEYAQSRVAQGHSTDHKSPRSKQQAQKFADMKQKSASLPKDLNEQHYQTLPVSKAPHPSTSSTQSKQGKGRVHQAPPVKVAILPATIQLRSGSEEAFLVEITSVVGMKLHFKLSPAYAIYLSLRDIVEVTPKSSLEIVLIEYLRATTDSLDQTVQLNGRVTPELAFWMANASELLNFVRHDIDVSPCTTEAQDTLAKSVQLAFRHLVKCMQRELYNLMPAFLSESDDDLPGGNESNLRNNSAGEPTMYDVLHMLSSAMSLLRRCRVNAALTIQLFSQLFHFVNMWIFNEVITKSENGYCCRLWGIKLRARLARIEAWAEKQGLELAADCHLARVTQAMHLLQAPKQSAEDIANISGTCFKLNSLQLRALLSQYIPSERDGERSIPNELIDKVVQVAQSTADELTRSDGRDVRLEEDPDLQLPFLLPEDGYSCDVVQSVPSGLTEFARPLVAEGICAYHLNPESNGSWTVHFMGEEETVESDDRPLASPSSIPPLVIEQPTVATVSFNKRGGGLGLSIVAARGPGQTTMGIYIRAVVKGGAADKDGRLQAGDQLLSVDGHSLVGLSQEKAAEIMTKSGQIVTLSVAKQAALFHGLSPLLEPSPVTEQHTAHRRPANQQNHQPRPKSDGFALQQGYQPSQNPAHPKQEKVSLPRSHQPRPLAQQHNNRKDRPINKSTTQLNEERDHKPHAYVSRGMQPPRSAISMGNLQRAPDNEASKTKALTDWQRTWEEKKALSTYQKNRAKSTSSNVLTPPAQSDGQYTYANQQNRREQVKSLFKHGHANPRPQEQKSPTPKAVEMTSKIPPSNQRSALDNPNYEQLPPPPTPPPMSPAASKSPESFASQKISPREGSAVSSKGYPKRETADSPKSQMMSHSATTEKKSKESSRPGQKSDFKSKSSTLPRHFKSAQVWDTDAQQRAIQEQLNALRDEEIDELSSRIDALSTLEKSRLNNLLKEREFQRRVEEESRRPYSDDDGSDEGYEVPDRPDRDRLIQMQDDHAEQFDASRDQEEELRREEERERKKQLEKERKEEEERERQLRERLERERILEEKRREEERRKQYEEEMRRQDEIRRREEEERAYQEELRRHEGERKRWEEERKRKEESELLRREEENRKQEERLRREQELQERQRRQWLAEERERRQREEREREAQKEREERERERQRLKAEREAREKEAQDARMEREARLRTMRFENEQKRRKERRMKSSEEDEREQRERELLENQLSFGKPSTFRKFNKPSTYGAASVYSRHASTSGNAAYQPPPTASKPVLRNGASRAPRPVSDGYFLGKTDHLADDDKNDLSAAAQNSTSTYNVSSVMDAPTTPTRNPVTYVTSHSTPGVIGAQERYKDPRDRREAQIKRDQSLKRRQQEPSFLTFKDRQRLFSAGQSTPVDRPRVSKKLLEIENSLKRGQNS